LGCSLGCGAAGAVTCRSSAALRVLELHETLLRARRAETVDDRLDEGRLHQAGPQLLEQLRLNRLAPDATLAPAGAKGPAT
jgi:hypothetical protein